MLDDFAFLADADQLDYGDSFGFHLHYLWRLTMLLCLKNWRHKSAKIGLVALLTFMVNVGYATDLYVGFPGKNGTKSLVCTKWVDRDSVSVLEDTGIYKGPYVCVEYYLTESDVGYIYIEKLLSNDSVRPIQFSNNEYAKSEWTPSFTQFNNNYYMAYKDGSNNGIRYSWSQDARYWNEPYTVKNLTSISTPQLVVFKNRMYMFFRKNDNRVYYTSTADGASWSSVRFTGEKSAKPPTLTVFQGKLFMAFRGGSTKNVYIKSTSNGVNWNNSVFTKQKSSEAPSVTVHNNQLFMAFKGSSTQYIYLMRSSNGTNWSGAWIPNKSWNTNKGPAIVSYENRLYLSFKGRSSSKVYYASSANGINSWNNAVVKPNAKSKGMLNLAIY
jgi:hypothetical protein